MYIINNVFFIYICTNGYFGTMVQWYFLVLLQEKMRALFLVYLKT